MLLTVLCVCVYVCACIYSWRWCWCFLNWIFYVEGEQKGTASIKWQKNVLAFWGRNPKISFPEPTKQQHRGGRILSWQLSPAMWLELIIIITTTTICKAISVLPWRFQDKIHRKLLHVTQYILSTHQSLLLILLGSKGSLELRVPLISLTNWAVFHPQMESKQFRKHKWKV